MLRGRNKGRRGRRSKTRMPPEHIAILQQIVDAHPYYYLDEIREHFFQETKCRAYSDTTIWWVLRDKLNYSLQVVINRAKQQDLDEQWSYFAALHDIVYQPEMAVFIDETAKDENAARRRRHWSPRQKTPVRGSFFMGENDRKRYTLLSACDSNGFIIEACELVEREHSQDDQDLTRGTIDTDRFLLWVQECLVPTLGNCTLGEKRSVVIMDNATIHHDDRIIEAIEAAGARVLYTAPYSPKYNPIEYMFGKYKQMLKRYHAYDWFTCHNMALRSISPKDARSWFRHCGVPGCEEEFAAEDDQDDDLVLALIATAVTFDVI